jgi:hypothetical protein
MSPAVSSPRPADHCPRCHFSEPYSEGDLLVWPHEPGCRYDGLSYDEAEEADRAKARRRTPDYGGSQGPVAPHVPPSPTFPSAEN